MRRTTPHRTWFEDVFGFQESSYDETRERFGLEDGGRTLVVKDTGKRFYIGSFEVLTAKQLRDRLPVPTSSSALGALRFRHIEGDVKALHQDPANADAIFQAASQFNALEMVGPEVRPEDGITSYAMDATQGPACALSCPAATLYRNYLCMPGGLGQRNQQLDLLSEAGALLGNPSHRYWRHRNGYCFPTSLPALQQLNARLEADPLLGEQVRDAIAVAVHWSTEVHGCQHKVCQVFSSALPMAYFSGPSLEDWRPLATAVLDGLYDATLAAGAAAAARRGARARVLLTAVGGGVFGNPLGWVAAAVQRALERHAAAPLDVMLVHYGALPTKGPFLEIPVKDDAGGL